MNSLKEIQKILAYHKEELGQRYKVTEIGIFDSFVGKKQKGKRNQ